MAIAKKPRRLAKEDLRRIIEFCQSVEAKGLNPFLVEVEDLITVIREYFPNWKSPEELCLDAEAINQIATVIRMQSEWIKHRATALYRDPFLVEEKLRNLPIETVARIFLEAWRPIVELEQISIQGLDAAMTYWDALAPLDERWRKTDFMQTETGKATREEMIKTGILSAEAFSAELEKLWAELKETTDKTGRAEYWDFVGADSYNETVKRAYLASFLVTYGYATLDINPLEEKIFIRPHQKLVSKKDARYCTFPISVSHEEWMKWKQGQEALGGKPTTR